MEQPSTSAIVFREVDRDGNPVTGDHPLDAAGDAGRSNAPAFNPFIAVLWLLTTLLIGGGAWIFLNADSMVGPSAGGGMPTSFLIFTFAPYALFAGLAALISLLFWHALQWQRRRSQPAQQPRRQVA
jgi:hypothetical protein